MHILQDVYPHSKPSSVQFKHTIIWDKEQDMADCCILPVDRNSCTRAERCCFFHNLLFLFSEILIHGT